MTPHIPFLAYGNTNENSVVRFDSEKASVFEMITFKKICGRYVD